MIEPAGEHAHPASGLVQVIDAEALDRIVRRFADEARQPGFAGLLVDQEHFSHDQDKASRAFGWLTALQARPDGLYGRIRWTASGRAAVDGGDYRFFSTEYEARDLAPCGPGRARPERLAGLALTNKPNNRGGRPITNRQPEETPRPAASAAAAPTEPTHNHIMNLIATQLGLPGEAGEQAVLAELARILNRASELEAEITALRGARVEADLERYQGRFAAGEREAWRALLVANRDAALQALAALPESAGPAGGLVCNRAQARVPAAPAPNAREARQREVTTLMRGQGCDFETAWNLARAARPELFVE
jgi:hypothetical protein